MFEESIPALRRGINFLLLEDAHQRLEDLISFTITVLELLCERAEWIESKPVQPNQIQVYFTTTQLSNKRLLLKKIIFSEVPRISTGKEGSLEAFRPYIQIFKESKILFNSLNSGRVAAYSESDLSIWFDLAGTEVSEDILIRCKHYESNKVRFPVFRMMLHTGFTQDNVLRLLKNDIDFTANVQVSDSFFIDLIFEESKQKLPVEQQNVDSQKTNLEYIVDECLRKQNERNKDGQHSDNDAQQEIDKILASSSTDMSSSSTPGETPVFSIGHFESAEKRKHSTDTNEEEKQSDDEYHSDQNKEAADSDDSASLSSQSEDKKKAQKLLFEDKAMDVDLDDQEIDDYLDNLEKSDDEQ